MCATRCTPSTASLEMEVVFVRAVTAIRRHVVDVDDGAFIVDRDRRGVVEVFMHHGACSLGERVIQELIKQHSTEEDRMTPLAVEGGHDQRRAAVLKHVDEFLHGVFVNQGMINGAEGNSFDGIIDDPE